MNKKLFIAGVALLAAVGFTSCNSDTPIDPSSPSGIAPAAVGHQVGVDYDWAVKAKDVAQFEEYWAADKDAVQKLVKDKKVASICIIADEFTLENKKIVLPQLWTDATGKIINVRIAGGFKNPDFMRQDWLKNGMAAKKWAVKISTSANKGAEVNFTIDSGEFDLDLESEYTRTTIDGAYTIGYAIVQAAKGMSATEFKSGVVNAIDNTSSGDIKELNDAIITGVWTRGTAVDVTAEKGIYVGSYVVVENVFVEADATIKNIAYDENKKFKLGLVQVVNPNKAVTVTFAKKKIDATLIQGSKASVNFMDNSEDATTIDLSHVDEINDITVKGATTLTKDVYTGVIFNDAIKFNTEKVSQFDNVAFNKLDAEIHADDVTVTFDGVNFLQAVDLSSSLKYTYSAAGYTSTYYQWFIEDKDPKVGHYVKCKDDLSDLFAYNVGKEKGTYTTADIVWNSTTNTFDDGVNKKAAEAKTYAIVELKTPYGPGEYVITPEGTEVILTSTCKFTGKTDDYSLNQIWGEKDYFDEGAWYSVKYADKQYIWKKLDGKKTYVLIPAE